jgi:hypothetical protein
MQAKLNPVLARCPRCRGNLGLEYDPPGGWDVVCLQCGFRRAASTLRSAMSDRMAVAAGTAVGQKKAA